MSTKYAAIKNNYFGEYIDNSYLFKGIQDLTTAFAVTQNADSVTILNTGNPTEAVSFQNIASAKMIVIVSTGPIDVTLNGARVVACDPLLILTNNGLTGATGNTSLSMTRCTGNTIDTTVNVYIRG